jgi:hypothetical protein
MQKEANGFMKASRRKNCSVYQKLSGRLKNLSCGKQEVMADCGCC